MAIAALVLSDGFERPDGLRSILCDNNVISEMDGNPTITATIATPKTPGRDSVQPPRRARAKRARPSEPEENG